MKFPVIDLTSYLRSINCKVYVLIKFLLRLSFLGYIGRGMLHGAVLGNVFTSAPAKNCLSVILNVAKYFLGNFFFIVFTVVCKNFYLKFY